MVHYCINYHPDLIHFQPSTDVIHAAGWSRLQRGTNTGVPSIIGLAKKSSFTLPEWGHPFIFDLVVPWELKKSSFSGKHLDQIHFHCWVSAALVSADYLRAGGCLKRTGKIAAASQEKFFFYDAALACTTSGHWSAALARIFNSRNHPEFSRQLTEILGTRRIESWQRTLKNFCSDILHIWARYPPIVFLFVFFACLYFLWSHLKRSCLPLWLPPWSFFTIFVLLLSFCLMWSYLTKSCLPTLFWYCIFCLFVFIFDILPETELPASVAASLNPSRINGTTLSLSTSLSLAQIQSWIIHTKQHVTKQINT